MTNYEIFIEFNDKMKRNIEKIKENDKMKGINSCISFTEDMQLLLSCCGKFKEYELVKEAQDECVKSIIMCVQGFYKEAMIGLRQFVEHMLFAIWLSTSDYNYRLWKNGKFDMSWAQITDSENGILGKKYICTYASAVDESRSLELLTIAKNIYRECSEYVHGNYCKLLLVPANLEYSETMLDKYVEVFESVKYLICMSLIIRFWDIINTKELLIKLESVLMDNLGSISEIQLLYSKEEGVC